METKYKHICIMEPPNIVITTEELQHKTLVIWIGEFKLSKLEEALGCLVALHKAETDNNFNLGVKFVAIDLKSLTSLDKVETAMTLEKYDSGLLDTEGKNLEQFGRWYDNRIENKIEGLRRLEDEEIAKELTKKAQKSLGEEK